ncbi:MAG: emopamil-binding family protein [Myxococcota bacterium]
MTASRSRLADRVVAIALLAMALAAFTMDRSAALDLCAVDSPDPFGRALWAYGERYDPLVAANPHFLQIMSGISAFVFGPLELAIAYGLWTRRAWVRGPAIVWSIAMLYSMVVHVLAEYWGPMPTPHPGIAVAAYSAYIIVPLVLVRWLWNGPPTRSPPPS